MSRKRKLPGGLHPAQEIEIYTILDKAVQLNYEEPFIYKCTHSRATWLYRHITGEILRNAYESVMSYPPGNPLYGKGIYYEIELAVVQQGLLFTRLRAPKTSPAWLILKVYTERQPVRIAGNPNATITTLRRYLIKYPYVAQRVDVSVNAGSIMITPIVGLDTPLPDIDTNPKGHITGLTSYKGKLAKNV